MKGSLGFCVIKASLGFQIMEPSLGFSMSVPVKYHAILMNRRSAFVTPFLHTYITHYISRIKTGPEFEMAAVSFHPRMSSV